MNGRQIFTQQQQTRIIRIPMTMTTPNVYAKALPCLAASVERWRAWRQFRGPHGSTSRLDVELPLAKWSSLPVCALTCMLLVPACAYDAESVGADVAVVVDESVTHQRMQGFGSSERVFDDPHLTETYDQATQRAAVVVPPGEQAKIYDALYSELGLTRVRAILSGNGVEPTNDNDDPLITNLSKFHFGWKNSDAHIDYAREARKRGVTVDFPSPLGLEAWMREGMAAEYAEWCYAVIHRWRQEGAELHYYAIINEPGYERGGVWSGEFMRDVIKILGPRLREEGMNTVFVIPDDLNATEAAKRATTILADPDARKYVGAIAFHLYDEPVSKVRKLLELAREYNLPLWMSEFSVGAMNSAGLDRTAFGWALLMHELITAYDVSAIDYMWGFFGQWDSDSQYVVVKHAGNSYAGFERTKAYYYAGQFSRFVRPGAVRIEAASTSDHVDVSAYSSDKDGTLTIVAINKGSAAVRTRFLLQNTSAGPIQRIVRTSQHEDWKEVPVPPHAGDGLAFLLPERSVTTIVLNRMPTLASEQAPCFGCRMADSSSSYSSISGAVQITTE